MSNQITNNPGNPVPSSQATQATPPTPTAPAATQLTRWPTRLVAMAALELPRLTRAITPAGLAALGALVACVLWAYWPTLAKMGREWSRQPEYSHGFLVPLFALALLYLRRHLLEHVTLRPNWWGVPLLLLGLGLRLAAVKYYFDWFDGVSLLVMLAGLTLLLGGWSALRWAWPAVAFLIFMVPLPFRVQVALANPLQSIATTVTTYVMQTIGLPALSEGHTIIINDIKIGVVAACSGLSMLMVFFALSTAVALLIHRPLVDRIVIVLSAVPIAVAANVIRITVTGLLHVWLTGTALDEWFRRTVDARGLADKMFHDWFGWVMMLLALGMMWLELKFLSVLLLEPEEASVRPPLPPAMPRPAPPRPRRGVVPRTARASSAAGAP